ncbi:MAG: fasciclin domain-containing protein [Flavobacteriaceae bacterium]|nr:fasciclin domain-containing protein [Flavobacteriaceae bacterium]
MKSNLVFSIILMLLMLAACKKSEQPTQTVSQQKTAVEKDNTGQSAVVDEESAANALQVAKSLDDFSTLVTAIETAGVQDAVVNVGPLTVFAPTNDAFGKLPEGTVETLLQPENKSKLAFILTNHVAPANYPDKQLEKEAKKGRKLYMASGEYLVVENKDDGIYVGGTKVLQTVQVSNGWIHVIGDVLVPEEK